MRGTTISDDEYLKGLQAVTDAVAEQGGVSAAAKKLGIARPTVHARYEVAKRMGLKPHVQIQEQPKDVQSDNLQRVIEGLRSELDICRKSLSEAFRPKFSIRTDIIAHSDGIRVLAIGDAHKNPKNPDNSRFTYAGKYAGEVKHDVVISMGDWLDMLSLCFHVPNENYSGRAKPSFLQDIAAGKEAFEAFNDGLGSWKPEKHMTLGNHENRLWRIEDQAPQSIGMYQAHFDEMMTGAGFTYSPYGMTTFYGGVGFTHIPMTIMGKPMGGKQVLTSLGRDSVYDTVTGHTHVPGEVRTRKIGQRHITAVDAGCFLPYGYVEDYAEHTLGGWDWGLTDLLIKNGQIVERKWVSLLTLEEKYG